MGLAWRQSYSSIEVIRLTSQVPTHCVAATLGEKEGSIYSEIVPSFLIIYQLSFDLPCGVPYVRGSSKPAVVVVLCEGKLLANTILSATWKLRFWPNGRSGITSLERGELALYGTICHSGIAFYS